jgi:hypothetical protein
LTPAARPVRTPIPKARPPFETCSCTDPLLNGLVSRTSAKGNELLPRSSRAAKGWKRRGFALDPSAVFKPKRWGLGVYHGLRKTNLQHYLDEFVFRFNRRRTRHAAFDTLLGIGTRTTPAPTTY